MPRRKPSDFLCSFSLGRQEGGLVLHMHLCESTQGRKGLLVVTPPPRDSVAAPTGHWPHGPHPCNAWPGAAVRPHCLLRGSAPVAALQIWPGPRVTLLLGPRAAGSTSIAPLTSAPILQGAEEHPAEPQGPPRMRTQMEAPPGNVWKGRSSQPSQDPRGPLRSPLLLLLLFLS